MTELMQLTGAILTALRALRNLTGLRDLSGLPDVMKPVRYARRYETCQVYPNCVRTAFAIQ
jgi:hypothetical protein